MSRKRSRCAAGRLNGVMLVSKIIVLEVKSTVVAMVDVITGRPVYVRLKVTSRRSRHSCTHNLDGPMEIHSRRPAAFAPSFTFSSYKHCTFS